MRADESPQPGRILNCRLFPLPGVVLFPHAVLPLHIHELRYRQMVEDALASDNLIAVVQVRPEVAKWSPEPWPTEPVGCLGKIIHYDRLPAGRFSLRLIGLKRLFIQSEAATDRLYRVAVAEVLEDLHSDRDEARLRDRLVAAFWKYAENRPGIDPGLRKLLGSETIDLGALADVVAYALKLSPDDNQNLLSTPSAVARANRLLLVLGLTAPYRPTTSARPPARPTRAYPPPFSVN